MSSVPNIDGNASSGATNANSGRKHKSNDVGWEFGDIVDEKNLVRVMCLLCKKQFSGGVYRLKEHVANIPGNVAGYWLATQKNRMKCKQAIMDAKNKKKYKQKEEDALSAEVDILGEEELEEEMKGLWPRKKPNFLSPMDRFALPINPESSEKTKRQQNTNEKLFKVRADPVQEYVSNWVYEAGIPFNAIDNDSFKTMVEAIGQFGWHFKPSSQWQLREIFLTR
ncbi:hypothetical protein Dsin_002266 [Dipteronia sinensis]|uniref:BED-type domain-containing protein n=1 Tax=Dipteronia sinensis TaxID=43782 RepID=A0AAE0B6S2_9ROSI|nr:hypothetical protein Dsin_002266 [Dipteronia sinensis]